MTEWNTRPEREHVVNLHCRLFTHGIFMPAPSKSSLSVSMNTDAIIHYVSQHGLAESDWLHAASSGVVAASIIAMMAGGTDIEMNTLK